jgi:hypothetical protein
MRTLKELYDNNLGAKFINDLMNDCMSIAKEFRAREAVKACQGNLNLKEIVISAEKIGESAFEGCTNLERVKLTGGNVKIGPYAFKNCTSLKSINLENVVSFGSECFSDCLSLEELYLSSKQANIGYGAFMRCTNLKTVCFTDRQSKVKFYGSCFDGCSSLETVCLPLGVSFYHIKETYMPEKSLFGGCDSLKGIYVPKEEFAWYCDLYLDEFRDKIKPC